MVWLLRAAGQYAGVVVVVMTAYVASPWAPDSDDPVADQLAAVLSFAVTDLVVIGIPTLGVVWLVAQSTRRIGRPWVTRLLAAMLTLWIPGLWVLFAIPVATARAAMAAQVVFAAACSPIWPPRSRDAERRTDGAQGSGLSQN